MEIEAIQKLIEEDEKTRGRIASENEKKLSLKKSIEEENQKLSDQSWSDAKKKAADTKKQLDEQIQNSEKMNTVYYEKASADLKKKYDTNKEKWRKELLNRIISTDGE